MGERPALDDRIVAIDRIFRELTWHGQKHAIHTLTRPEIGLTMPQTVTALVEIVTGIHERFPFLRDPTAIRPVRFKGKRKERLTHHPDQHSLLQEAPTHVAH